MNFSTPSAPAHTPLSLFDLPAVEEQADMAAVEAVAATAEVHSAVVRSEAVPSAAVTPAETARATPAQARQSTPRVSTPKRVTSEPLLRSTAVPEASQGGAIQTTAVPGQPLPDTALNAPVMRQAPTARPKVARPEARWQIPNAPDEAAHRLAAECSITPVLAAILRGRGHESAQSVNTFLDPSTSDLRDPHQLPDLPQAVERLYRAINNKEKMLVCGDYDVDGITATALLWRSLRDLGANVTARVPERCEGYDLKVGDVETAAANGYTLIITADNGIRAIKSVERARELGVDVLITDHHEPGPELPQACAVVNPKREDSAYGFRELCGCAVAYKLMLALLHTHWPQYVGGFERKFLELAAIATVADCMPLEDENRIIVRDGLSRLALTKKRGLQALLRTAGLEAPQGFKASDVAFRLAPRINSAGRFSRATDALSLLMSTDEAHCRDLAESIEELNGRRQKLVEEIVGDAIGLVEAGNMTSELALVIAGGKWGHGVVGLIASRMVEMYGRPALVFGEEDDHWRGSGRSIPGFDLMHLIEATRDLQLSGGGHKAACGLSIRKDAMDEFRQRAVDAARAHLAEADLAPRVTADVLVTGHDLAPQLLDDLALLQPCGQGNPSARLMLRGARVLNAQVLGAAKNHLKWRLKCGERTLEAVWWRNADKAARWGSGSTVDLCFAPEWNEYRGQRTMQLKIDAARDAA